MLFVGLVFLICLISAEVGAEIPSWVVSNGDLRKMQPPHTTMPEYKLRPSGERASDGEHIDAMHEFFWDKYNLVAMELGAMGGVKYSETLMLEQLFGWKRLLVEGNPLFRKDLAGPKMKGALAVNAVICEAGKTVHYPKIDKMRSAPTAGIIEHMSPHFFKSFHSFVWHSCNKTDDTTAIDWDEPSCADTVIPVPCVPLGDIFSYGQIKHVDFFVLDVEGAELTILETIPWKDITFDVIVVETDPSFRPEGYAQQVAEYLAPLGYNHVSGVPGRNSWFEREGFVRSKFPHSKPGCFGGAISAMINRGKIAWKNIEDYQASKEFDCLHYIDQQVSPDPIPVFPPWGA